IRFGFERQANSTATSVLEFHEVSHKAQHMCRELGNRLGSGDARLEAEMWTLDRGRRSFGRDIRQDLSNIDRVLRPFFGAPVGLVDLLFDGASLEGTVRKRIHRV